MFWNKLLSGESFANWISNLIPDPATNPTAKFNKGPTLDPFETSKRNTKKYTELLTDISNGIDISSERNGYTDLKKSGVILKIENRHELSPLGKNTLLKWRELGIDNNSDSDEFYRMLVLILEARKLNLPQYLEMLSFWKEIKKTGDSIQYITNPTSLYLMGVLNQDVAGFNPWKFILENNSNFDPVDTVPQLKSNFSHKPEVVSRIEKIEGIWSSDFRPKGRQIFCLAMDCVTSTISEASENVGLDSVSEFVGTFSKENLERTLLSYGIANIGHNEELIAENRIFYGAPGTGKSTEARKRIRGSRFTTTTFHPATDYGSFVGYYKPLSKENENGEVEVSYGFQPQHFLKAYVSAWNNLSEKQFLLIEEINRGNCAKIFGDIFQLLDRDEQGFSDYVISVDKDIADYLKKELKTNSQYKEAIEAIVQLKNHYKIDEDDVYNFMCLPNNLSILATMNTSDQSLFPMDSAFKRRWNWTYIPINAPENSVFIEVCSDKYDWFDFVKKANKKIALVTESEDKKIGTFFVKSKNNIIGLDEFVNKVLFYLWNDIYKDEYTSDLGVNVFIAEKDNSEVETIMYSELYDDNNINLEIVKKLLDANSINKVT